MIDLKQQRLREAIEAMYFAYREFTAKPDEILTKFDLNRVHHRILYFVGKYPGISVGALIELLKVSKQAMHTPVRQLVDKGLIDNRVDNKDRRSRRLYLTDSGNALEQTLTQAQLKLLDRAFNDCPELSLSQWSKLMNAIASQG